MSKNKLELKPISALLDKKFFIPGYQRGYRWTKRQVEDLLNDIREFQRDSESKKKETFYCLQPLVVREHGNSGEWELIDGQQRLTTIYLILLYLKDILAILGKTPYSLHYETREDSELFLKDIDFEKRGQNIDYFHICNAYEAITEWFAKQDGTYKIKFLQTLLNDDDTGKNVKVIWYDIQEHIDPVEVFTRLNIGKIPLTNAELVKALFLRSRNFEKDEVSLQQLKIAQEWDAIEKALQADDFWYFISNGNGYANRIEFILELMAEEHSGFEEHNFDHYHTFNVFSHRINEEGIDSEEEWRRIKRYFMKLEEWYKDRYYFHLVGYLVSQGVAVREIDRMADGTKTKQSFKHVLKDEVFSRCFGRFEKLSNYPSPAELRNFISDSVGELRYGSEKIKPTLLLFNISTLLRSTASNLRYQFDSFKKENWDIEHVRSVKSEKPDRTDLQKEWITAVIEYVTGKRERQEQEVFIAAETDFNQKEKLERSIKLFDTAVFDTAEFDALYEEYLAHYDEQIERETDNSIGNLALLDANTNRSYKNAMFPIKRQRILALDKSSKFVPLCTKHVFLKYYSDKINQMMHWHESDRDQYEQAIVDTLVWFFTHEKGDES